MENQVIKRGLKNSIIVVVVQLVSFFLGIAKALVLPILLGVTNFGYWQVYLLYMSYVGIFAIGFNDGIYLRYGKYDYKDLPEKTFRSSIKVFIIFQVIVMLLISLLILLEIDPNKQIAMLWATINIPIAGLSGVLIYIFQVTNQLSRYSYYTILDKIIVLIMIALVFLFKIDQFTVVIVADTLSKVFVLILMIYSCREIIFGKGIQFKKAYREVLKNINVGIKLMLANLAGMLVLGFGRFFVERFESIEVYATYSFAISTINLILVFITAIGLVVYPTLSRLEKRNFSKYFKTINEMVGILVLVLLAAYYPVFIFIKTFMKDYIQIFEYLPIIFSIIFIQAKMQILINPYYKVLREEREMLKANIIGLVIAIILILPTYFLYNSVFIIAIGTLLAMSIRLYLSELYLRKKLYIKNKFNIIFEIIGIIIFILFAYSDNKIFGFVGYMTFLILYISFHFNNIYRLLKMLNLKQR